MITAETLVDAAKKAVAVKRRERTHEHTHQQNTRLLVQALPAMRPLHTSQMFTYKTNVVAGVTPGKGGEWVLDGNLVFDRQAIVTHAERTAPHLRPCALSPPTRCSKPPTRVSR